MNNNPHQYHHHSRKFRTVLSISSKKNSMRIMMVLAILLRSSSSFSYLPTARRCAFSSSSSSSSSLRRWMVVDHNNPHTSNARRIASSTSSSYSSLFFTKATSNDDRYSAAAAATTTTHRFSSNNSDEKEEEKKNGGDITNDSTSNKYGDIVELQSAVSSSASAQKSNPKQSTINNGVVMMGDADEDDDEDDDDAQKENEHLRHQQEVFDSMSAWFADREKEVTPELEPVYQAMAQDIIRQLLPVTVMPSTSTFEEENSSSTAATTTTTTTTTTGVPSSTPATTTTVHILDVACGTGVLWEFLLEAANQANIALNITGVDLSPSMIGHASKRAEFLLDQHEKLQTPSPLPHTIQVVTSDIVAFGGASSSSSSQKEVSYDYDGIILNACFGNFWDPRAVLDSLLVSPKDNNNNNNNSGGSPSTPPKMTTKIFVSHPLGADFVQRLHDDDPKMVPHTLPLSTLSMVTQWTWGLTPHLLPTSFTDAPYYLMTLETGGHHHRRRAQPLPLLQRYRGVVDEGYGRGGKKLGVPTANLPASLFQNALQDVGTGVYFGWAALEHIPNQVFKAVVNVGYSPTFEGKENKEKIIEAHLILSKKPKTSGDDGGPGENEKDEEGLADFYGQVMRLQLNGYLRDEQKFDSFPALIAQIHADIDDAREALDECSPFADLQSDDFLSITTASTTSIWVGNGGGDETASWEFVNQLDVLMAMVDNSSKTYKK